MVRTNSTSQISVAAPLIGRMRHDPLLFVATFWPQINLAPYQVGILDSVRDVNETWVHSANGVGKTFTAALVAVWFFCTRAAIVITTAPTEQHLKSILWSEISTLLRSATIGGQPAPFGFLINELEIRHKDDAGAKIPRYFILGRVAEKVESLQGYHLAELSDGSPAVLFLFDEASAIRPEFFEAASAQAHRTLVIGNPLNCEGPFFETCRGGNRASSDGSGRLFRRVIHVSAEHSPNVIAGRTWAAGGRIGRCPNPIPGIVSFDEYQERVATWPKHRIRTRLHGLFADEAGQKLFPAETLDLAQQLGRKLEEAQARRPDRKKRLGRPFGLGVDVSFGGDDLTAWVVFGRHGVVHVEARPTPDTATIAGRTLRLMREYGIRAEAVAFDAGGGGKQIADAMRDKGYEVNDIHFGASPESEEQNNRQYRNRRAELYGELARAMEPTAGARRLLATPIDEWPKGARCVALPTDCGELREDLACLPLLHDGEGRLKLPPKDKDSGRVRGSGSKVVTVREMLGGRSPDRGDACVLAYWAYQVAREHRAAERIDRPLIY